MGNRATVIFVNKTHTEISPAVYLHWNGGPESVYPFLAELDRRDVRADQEYECARFIGIIAEYQEQEHYTPYSLGVSNGPAQIKAATLAKYDPGDNGIYVVCRDTGAEAVDRWHDKGRFVDDHWVPKLVKTNPAEVAREKRGAWAHECNTGTGTIASIFAGKETEAQHYARMTA